MTSSIQCPSCSAENEGAHETCFRCGRNLFALVEGSILSGRYEILRPLGQGGMGIVYVARDRELDEAVAIKVLRPEAAASDVIAQRFRSEIKLARKVTHPNVCRIHEYMHDGHLHFIVMELVEGVDLRELLRDRGPFPPAEAYAIAIKVAGALQAIHDVGIVHRDLKTPNIMRDKNGVIRVMDFGVAKSLNASASSATATGHVVGTPEYMSPEQAQGHPIDGRSDLYALGVVTFELFTGQVPLSGDSPLATLYKQISEPPPLDGPAAALLPKDVVPVLARALAKSPDERFASADEMAQALETARSSTAPARTVARPIAAPPSVRTRRTGLAIGVGVLVLAVGGAAAGFLSLRSAPKVPAPIRTDPTAARGAAATRLVRLNVLPWARVRVSALDAGALAPTIADDERTTPCAVSLEDGEYLLELENGGLTPPAKQHIRVTATGANDFSFTMPGYDPEAR